MIGKSIVARLGKQLAELERQAAAPIGVYKKKPVDALRYLQGMTAGLFVPHPESGFSGSLGMPAELRLNLWPAWELFRLTTRVLDSHAQNRRICAFAEGLNQSMHYWRVDRLAARKAGNQHGGKWPYTSLVLHECKAALAIDAPEFDTSLEKVYDYERKEWLDRSYGVARAKPITHLISALPVYHRKFPRTDTWPPGVVDQVEAALTASKSRRPAEVFFDWRTVPEMWWSPLRRERDGSLSPAVLAALDRREVVCEAA